ncbi:hypothetical protein Bbelb_101580 [Branchiostoma belcheri]|nr:hypothetical protein Bbelb_101580 [Branchiostoma belcheri]
MSFCYPGDMISQSGGCSEAVTARIKSAWKSFHELLPILTNSYIYKPTWAVTAEDMKRLTRSDRDMVRWMCSRKLADCQSTERLRMRTGKGQMAKEDPYTGCGGRKWFDNIREDLYHQIFDKINPQDRDKWRAAIKPQMYSASTSNPRKTGNKRR